MFFSGNNIFLLACLISVCFTAMDAMQSRAKKFDPSVVTSTYNTRPNVYANTSTEQLQQIHGTNGAASSPPSSPVIEYGNPDVFQSHPIEYRHNIINPIIIAQAAEAAEKSPYDQEEGQIFNASDLNREASPYSATKSTQRIHSNEVPASDYNVREEVELPCRKGSGQSSPSDESFRRLGDQLVSPIGSETLVSRFRTSPRRQYDSSPPVPDTVELGEAFQPNEISNIDNNNRSHQMNTGGTYQRNAQKPHHTGEIPLTEDRSIVVVHERPQTVFESSQRHNKDLENGHPNTISNDESNINERSRLYESQLELYVGFIGIQIIFIYANFVFANYAGGILSLFTFIAACYSHLDRRPSSYALTSVILTIQIIVLCIAVTVGIHGFYLYRTDPTLKAISVGAIPLGIVFIFLNISLGYQHSYSTGSAVL